MFSVYHLSNLVPMLFRFYYIAVGCYYVAVSSSYNYAIVVHSS
ncbi:hypothetical protein BVRB_5g104490 [Beta vulgaris subsp. vulgaris]|uniref:Uncharacterized protein n=1 Tax=Beta vulgaris subsp. vulgaris TaxID=3555 RepID=A0A0J8F7E1_BETVV|nr:hypothetical protein BVRB_5g104490 [Beta vulgaris subsp. vulgaris]